MSKRIHLDVPLDSPLQDERFEREETVPDAIKIDHGRLEEMLKYGLEVGIDSERLISLLAGTDTADLTPKAEHRVNPGDEIGELSTLLSDLMEGLEDDIETNYSLVELRTNDEAPEPEHVLSDDDVRRYELYFKSCSIRKLAEFALEHDEGLVVG